jgi:ubiquinone/menaquinone biosynthesis C-methylase UbiE
MDPNLLFRALYQNQRFAAFYANLAGEASVRVYSETLETRLLAQTPPGGRILEVGSGPGLQAIEILRRHPDLNITASDFADSFVELGRLNFRQAQAKGLSPTTGSLSFLRADAMDLSRFPDASFHAVYSITVLKHFPDPLRGINESLRVLQPGGALLYSEFKNDSTLDEITNLTREMKMPAFLRSAFARFIHHGVPQECPSLDKVKSWLDRAQVEPANYSFFPLPGFPVWVLVVNKPSSGARS